MKEATLKQAGKVIELVGQKETPCKQLQELLASGLLSDLLDANIDSVDRNAFRKLLGLDSGNLLELLGAVTIPARTERFIAKNHFVVDTGKKAKVKISFLGDNFRERFLGKIENSIAETNLQYYKLKKKSVDGPIIAELGGNDKAKTTLAEMFALMEKQGNGESGILLTDGYANIFYICDYPGVVWAVHCYWYGVGWRVLALSVEGPDRWDEGDRVFSREF